MSTTTITTANTSKTDENIIYSDGGVGKRVTSPNGEVVTTYIISDGLDTYSQSTCGPRTQIFSDLDPWYGYTYIRSNKVFTPAELEMMTSVEKFYTDDNSDDYPEIITTQVTVNNQVSTLVHDVVNSTRTITSPENRTVTTTYDPNTLQIVSSSVPGLHDTSYSYRSDGKVSSVTTGSRSVDYTYDAKGNVATITDPLNRTTSFTDYDAVGRVTRVVQPDSTVMQYGYDQNGNMTLLTTPIPADNTFTYNKVNKRSAYQTPLVSTTSYTYNVERQLTKVTLPSTKEITNTYSKGRLVTTVTDEWTNSYSYACGNLLGSVARGSEQLSYRYDGNLSTRITQTGTVNDVLVRFTTIKNLYQIWAVMLYKLQLPLYPCHLGFSAKTFY